jgi:hypothetical protein
MWLLRNDVISCFVILFQAIPLGHTETVMTDGPCKDNRFGDNSVSDGTYTYDNFFRGEYHSTFRKNGYVQLKNLIDQNAILHFWEKHFKDAQHTEMGSESQPRRFKILIRDKIMEDAQNIFRPAFFVAYQMIAVKQHTDIASTPYNSSVDWLSKLKSEFHYAMHSHNNAALPGSVFQNPHWDVPNTKSRGMILVDIPLIDVGAHNAPLEIWKGTHRTDYRRVFNNPAVIVATTNTRRQYWSCSKEMMEAAMKRPSSIVHSQIGDATVRTPATWHRGTPNNSSKTRDMITFLIQPSTKKPSKALR